jgi:uncharacterized protein
MNNRDETFTKISKLKEKSSEISREINLELSKSFLTPFDREDIYSLIAGIDKIAKNISSASSRINRYKVDKITNDIKQLAAINLTACINIDETISALENTKNINSNLLKTSNLESEADDIYNNAIEQLFTSDKPSIEILKYKEVLSALESVTDKCKGVSNILELIVVKHS